jgi:hypothetical protein
LDNQQEQESDTAYKNSSVAAKCCNGGQDIMQIELDITHHLINESDFDCVMIHPLNLFSDHIHLLGNQLITSSEIPDRAVTEG